MSEDTVISKLDICEFRNMETDVYSVWVYDGEDILKAYEEEHPNTVEVKFRFYKFNHFYWKLLEDECIDDTRIGSFYNYNKLKMFMIKRMLCSTSLPWIRVEYDKSGFLKESSFDSFMSIHPRILRVLMDKIDVLPKRMPKSEERELEKQCSILFGKGEGVMNPHPYITAYCNLVAFWEKFGMNYFDILKLPQDMFTALKKVMTLENTYKSAKLDEISKQSTQSQQNMKKNTRSVKF